MKEDLRGFQCTRCNGPSMLRAVVSGSFGGEPVAVIECSECGHIETRDSSPMPIPRRPDNGRHWSN